MSGKRGVIWFGLGIALVAWLGGTAAAAPWDKLLTLNRVEASSEKTYQLTEDHGPWMILACSFSGEKAEEQAQALVLELRKRYKLPAYQYKKRFDFGKDVYGLGVDRYGNPRKMKYLSGRSEAEEIAVLVGNYPDATDPEAQETLRKLKYYQPECLKLENGKDTARNLAGWRQLVQTQFLPAGSEKKFKGPMGQAMITNNPLLPEDYYRPKGVDEVVLRANEGVDFCLLDCPGKYSVMVAHFTGRSVILGPKRNGRDDKQLQQEITKLKKLDVDDSQLVQAAEKAHEMTMALRKAGIDAYEFHDHAASIVAVGSFESVGTKDADGVIQLDPRVLKVIEQYKARRVPTKERPDGTLAPRRLSEVIGTKSTADDIPFDVQPMVVEVPKRPTMSLFRRDTASR